MRTLLVGSTVFMTIIASLAFGIGCGYLAIAAILRIVGHRPRAQETAPTNVAAATSASGD